MVRKIGAKRKKAPAKRKTTGRRRRRMSGIGSMNMQGMAMKAAGLVAGAVLAREANTIAVKQFPTLSPMMSGIGQIALGILIPHFVKNNKFVADMGDGMIANGGMVVIVSTGAISGMGHLGASNMRTYRINGRNNMRAIAGTNNLPTVAGLNSGSTVAGAGVGYSSKRSRFRGVYGA